VHDYLALPSFIDSAGFFQLLPLSNHPKPRAIFSRDDDRDKKPSVLAVRQESVTLARVSYSAHEDILQSPSNLSRQPTLVLTRPFLACRLRGEWRSAIGNRQRLDRERSCHASNCCTSRG
jgi:hypothetical protein